MNLAKSEPVRLYLYSLLVPVVALLVFLGVVDAQSAPLWIALVTAVLGVPAVEAARAAVTPVAPAASLLVGQ
jgi:hypothetical protein